MEMAVGGINAFKHSYSIYSNIFIVPRIILAKIRWVILLCFLTGFLVSGTCFAQTAVTTCNKVENMLYLVQKVHYQPPVFDKIFASKVMERYLFYIDGQGCRLYEKDILQLKEIQQTTTSAKDILCTSFDFLFTIYAKRAKETDSLAALGINKKYVWREYDSLPYYESFKNDYPKNIQEKISRTDKWIKMNMLRQLEVAEKLTRDYEFEKNQELKIKAVSEFRKSLGKETNSIEETKAYLEENLLQAIMATCDPHSDYFTPLANKQFQESLSVTVEVFGFSFNESQSGQIEVTAIDPGSPAWKSNKVNVGDIVTKVQFKDKKQVDVSNYSFTDFDELMSNALEKEMNITLLKKSGAIVEVHLLKAEVKSEDNRVNGYILSGKDPVGYISLPSFYTDFSGTTPLGCANDVAKEIVKLKQDSIKGLILDLRNNGGGSIDEAINLAGIFIDAAPLFIEKIHTEKPRVIKDMNRGAIYTGPLVVMINKGSASASELLAQIFKTQHRAIIVGTNSYGKATGQLVIPFDTSFSLYESRNQYNETNGYIKVTIEKLYDLTGATHQKTGVQPHVPIPDLWSSFFDGEKEYNNALPNDVIDKRVVVNTPPDEKINEVRHLSEARISVDKQFNRMLKLTDTLSRLDQRNVLPLHPLKYHAMLKTIKDMDSIAYASFAADTSFIVRPNRSNKEVIKMDGALQTTINEEIIDLQKDIILKETYHILTDYNSNSN